MTTALQGLKVLDLTKLLPGPYCSLMLADFGAEVIKIEPPGAGDFIRWMPPTIGDTGGMYLVLNRNKKSMTLNLKEDRAREIFYKMAREADIVLEGFRPGVAAKLGVDYDTLKEINPRLVYCSISGYGQDGPYALKAGHDCNYLSYAGVLGLTGEAGGAPVIPAVQIADLGGGAMMALSGILMALLAREKTGRGQFVDIAMMDGVVSWLPILAGQYFAGATNMNRGKSWLTGLFACYNVYKAGDGGFLALGALETWFWEKLCRYLGREDYIPLQFDEDRQPEMIGYLGQVFATKPRDQWVQELEALDICLSPVYDLPEVFEDPQVRHRQMITQVEHPRLGTLKQLGFPIKLSETPAAIKDSPPELGQHTGEILGGLGFSPEEIAELEKAKII